MTQPPSVSLKRDEKAGGDAEGLHVLHGVAPTALPEAFNASKAPFPRLSAIRIHHALLQLAPSRTWTGTWAFT